MVNVHGGVCYHYLNLNNYLSIHGVILQIVSILTFTSWCGSITWIFVFFINELQCGSFSDQFHHKFTSGLNGHINCQLIARILYTQPAHRFHHGLGVPFQQFCYRDGVSFQTSKSAVFFRLGVFLEVFTQKSTIGCFLRQIGISMGRNFLRKKV